MSAIAQGDKSDVQGRRRAEKAPFLTGKEAESADFEITNCDVCQLD
jgi:hypothetical protein